MTYENGHNVKELARTPTEELQRLTGDELPFDEATEIQLALDTCQALDDDALEQLAAMDFFSYTDARAAVEQLAYAAWLRGHYIDRLRNLRRRLDEGHEATVMRFVFRKPATGLDKWTGGA